MTPLAATSARFDVARVRADFPILRRKVRGKPLVYLDNAATTQKPQAVLDALTNYYTDINANVHRGVHELSGLATDAYEGAREKIRAFFNARSVQEVVYTRNATESINLVAYAFVRPTLAAGDEVVISAMEHHSNIVPWQLVCEERGARLRVAPIDDRGALILDELDRLIGPQTKIVSVAHMSNALGTINPVAEIVAMAHARGVPVLIDGSQAAYHMPVDVQALGCDFYAATGHKLYGPTGIGVLVARAERLEAMPPFLGGGDMIRSVTFERSTWNDLPYKFEAGTPNIAGAIGLGAAIDYIQSCRARRHRRARSGAAALRHRAARVDSRCSADRHGAGEVEHPVVRDGGHSSARHRYDRGSGGGRGQDGPPLRAAGHGAVRHRGHRPRVAGDVQHQGRSGRARPRAREGARGVQLMSELKDLYQEVILDHNKRPRNYHAVENASHSAEGYNPLCGDRLNLYLKVEDGVVTDVGFQGAGCAISKASASLMTDSIKGRPVAEVRDLFQRFHAMVTTPPDKPVENLGKLSVLSGVREFPVRVKCASLAWHTLKAALDREQLISTE